MAIFSVNVKYSKHRSTLQPAIQELGLQGEPNLLEHLCMSVFWHYGWEGPSGLATLQTHSVCYKQLKEGKKGQFGSVI